MKINKMLLKEFFKKVCSFIGIRISRTGRGILAGKWKYSCSKYDEFKWIKEMNIKTIIDVGAHIGQSALKFHELFPNAKIYSFEPLNDCFMQLNANLKNVPNFKSFKLALGDKKGKINIHRSEFSASSSLLKMGKLHKEAFPFSARETIETIDVDTLDNIAQYLDLEENILLKIDVQGYEARVIKCGRNLLSKIKIIIVETSFHELYEGQPLFSDIYEILEKEGFTYSGSWGELDSPVDGTPLQQDSIFIRR